MYSYFENHVCVILMIILIYIHKDDILIAKKHVLKSTAKPPWMILAFLSTYWNEVHLRIIRLMFKGWSCSTFSHPTSRSLHWKESGQWPKLLKIPMVASELSFQMKATKWEMEYLPTFRSLKTNASPENWWLLRWFISFWVMVPFHSRHSASMFFFGGVRDQIPI